MTRPRVLLLQPVAIILTFFPATTRSYLRDQFVIPDVPKPVLRGLLIPAFTIG